MRLMLFSSKRDLAFSILVNLFPRFEPMAKKIFLT